LQVVIGRLHEKITGDARRRGRTGETKKGGKIL
jgi:hypothetical protein